MLSWACAKCALGGVCLSSYSTNFVGLQLSDSQLLHTGQNRLKINSILGKTHPFLIQIGLVFVPFSNSLNMSSSKEEMNAGIEFEFVFLWNVVGQILILCRTCMMRKWSSIKTKKAKPLERPGKKAVARSKHCRWILMPCCPISGKWGATRLIHVCFMAKRCQIRICLTSSDYLLYFRKSSTCKLTY